MSFSRFVCNKRNQLIACKIEKAAKLVKAERVRSMYACNIHTYQVPSLRLGRRQTASLLTGADEDPQYYSTMGQITNVIRDPMFDVSHLPEAPQRKRRAPACVSGAPLALWPLGAGAIGPQGASIIAAHFASSYFLDSPNAFTNGQQVSKWPKKSNLKVTASILCRSNKFQALSVRSRYHAPAEGWLLFYTPVGITLNLMTLARFLRKRWEKER